MPISVSNSNLNISTSNQVQNKNESNVLDKTSKTQTKQNNNSRVEEYYEKLCSRFPDLKISLSDKYVVHDQPKLVPIDTSLYSNDSTSVWGNVYLHIDYLKKASENPEIAKELERKLSEVPLGEQWVRNYFAGSDTEVTSFGNIIGSDGKSCSFSSLRMPRKTGSYLMDNKDTINRVQENALKQLKKNKGLEKKNPTKVKEDDSSEDTDSKKIWEQVKQEHIYIKELREEEYFKHKDELYQLNKDAIKEKKEKEFLQNQKMVADYERNFLFDNTNDNE